MRTNVSFAIFAGAVALLIALSAAGLAQSVRYNAAPGTNFSQYKTYKWVKVEGAQYPNQLIDDQIMRSIDGQMASTAIRTSFSPTRWQSIRKDSGTPTAPAAATGDGAAGAAGAECKRRPRPARRSILVR